MLKTKNTEENHVSNTLGKICAKMSHSKIATVFIMSFVMKEIWVDRSISKGPICAYEKMEPKKSSFRGKICATKLLNYLRSFASIITLYEVQNINECLLLCGMRSTYSRSLAFCRLFWIIGQKMWTFWVIQERNHQFSIKF